MNRMIRVFSWVGVGLALLGPASVSFAGGAPISRHRFVVNSHAYWEFKSLLKKTSGSAFNGDNPFTLAEMGIKSLTFNLQESFRFHRDLTVSYDDLREPKADHNVVTVKTADYSQGKGGVLRFTFDYGKPHSYFKTDDMAQEAARRFRDDLDTLIDDPSARVDLYEIQFRDSLKEYLGYGGKMNLPDGAHGYFVQAEAAASGMDFDEAVDLYYKGLLIAPWYPAAHHSLALLLGDQKGFYDDAIGEMKKFIDLSPKSTDIPAAQDKIKIWEGEIPPDAGPGVKSVETPEPKQPNPGGE